MLDVVVSHPEVGFTPLLGLQFAEGLPVVEDYVVFVFNHVCSLNRVQFLYFVEATVENQSRLLLTDDVEVFVVHHGVQVRRNEFLVHIGADDVVFHFVDVQLVHFGFIPEKLLV